MISSDVQTTEQDARIAIDLPDNTTLYLSLDLDTLRNWINTWINSAVASVADPANQTTKNQMMRLSLNSALLAIGPMIARMFWRGEGEPPKPGRKDDLMEWYVRFAAEQIVDGIANSTSMLHLNTARFKDNDEYSATLIIDAISSKSAAGR
jgi:hypothetical protein